LKHTAAAVTMYRQPHS